MSSFLNRYATPLTTGLFLVSLISGFALFFHLGSSYFHAMHEWLSVVLVLPFLLHIWKNWRAFFTYFKRPPMAIALGLSLAAAAVFVVPQLMASGQPSGVNPRAVIGLMTAGKVGDLAPLVGQTPESLIAALAAKGITATASQTLTQAAEASGAEPFAALGIVLAVRQ
ncbi:MAG: DUF4405 domain-containing protein [Notoacmeibacter sp.]|nr:DUF4405 domain-containing protein [Notoacmeibacter sp.]